MLTDKQEVWKFWIRTHPATRERWNARHVSNHERLVPFSNNLTTLMFIVVSDLSEAQRERLTSSLSLRGMNILLTPLNLQEQCS